MITRDDLIYALKTVIIRTLKAEDAYHIYRKDMIPSVNRRRNTLKSNRQYEVNDFTPFSMYVNTFQESSLFTFVDSLMSISASLLVNKRFWYKLQDSIYTSADYFIFRMYDEFKSVPPMFEPRRDSSVISSERIQKMYQERYDRIKQSRIETKQLEKNKKWIDEIIDKLKEKENEQPS